MDDQAGFLQRRVGYKTATVCRKESDAEKDGTGVMFRPVTVGCLMNGRATTE